MGHIHVSDIRDLKQLRALFFLPFPLALVLMALVGCTNNLTSGSKISSITSTTTNSGSFPLSRVVLESTSPAVLDLIGDGSGIIGNYCQSTAGTSAYDTTNCNCTYAYILSGSSYSIDVPVTYHENDLVRCSYSSIPSGVTSMTVSIHLTSADIYSSTVKFDFTTSSANVDTSDMNNFSRVMRYQCRDVVVVPSIFDGSLYDPIQSEDAETTYSLDFYSTSFGKSLTAYIHANLSYWDCPTILNPYQYITSNNKMTDYMTKANMNMRLFSQGTLDDGNGKQIYPTTTNAFDHVNFYLSNTSTGVFNIPVNGYIAPTVNTTTGNTTYPPLGYGASPIVSGTGRETCPDSSVPIPSGYQWVKIWLFRGDFPARNYYTSTDLTSVQSITCNPGDWVIDTNGTLGPSFKGCLNSQTTNNSSFNSDSSSFVSSFSLSSKEVNSTHFLADRVLYSGECFRMDDLGSPHSTTTISATSGGPNLCGSHPGIGCNSANTGNWKTDSWQAVIPQTADSSSIGCQANHNDKLHTCDTNNANYTGSGTLYSPVITPYTTTVTGQALDIGGSRYDFLYIVSDKDVTVDQMRIISSGPGLNLAPYRYLTLADCNAADPDQDSNCRTNANASFNSSAKLIYYHLKLHDVSTNGDPAAGDSDRTGVFPVCALQPSP